MSHRLRPDLRASGQALAQHTEATACIPAGVADKGGVNHHSIAVFHSRHTVCVKDIIYYMEIACRGGLIAGALLGDTGIIDALEKVILD